MANYDNPNGFRPVSESRLAEYTTSAAVSKGDLLAYVSGAVLPFATGTHTDAVGVAAHDAASGADVLVYDDPTTIFVGQTSGNYVAATYDGELVDVEGTTGIMEVNEDSTSNPVVQVLYQYPVKGSEDTGANARVAFVIAKHMYAPAYGLVDEMKDFAHIADLTDSTGGTADGTLAAISGSGADSDINNNFAECAAAIAAIHARLEAAGINLPS